MTFANDLTTGTLQFRIQATLTQPVAIFKNL